MNEPAPQHQDGRVRTERVAVVLHKPKYAGNVGFAARCAKNMGVGRLLLVGGDDLRLEEMQPPATHGASDLLAGMVRCRTLEEALAGFTYVVGATARCGAGRGPVTTPREMARRLIGVSRNNDVALLFGPEDRGLANDELRFCHSLVMIPTDPRFRSINLSHAVMVLCYELFVARTAPPETFTPRLALSSELEGMYGQLRDLLLRIGFLHPQNPERWMMHLRRMLSRTGLYAREVRIIRGICRQIQWFLDNKRA